MNIQHFDAYFNSILNSFDDVNIITMAKNGLTAKTYQEKSDSINNITDYLDKSIAENFEVY